MEISLSDLPVARAVLTIDHRIPGLCPSSVSLLSNTRASLACGHSDWAIQSYHRTLLDFCDEIQACVLSGVRRLAGPPGCAGMRTPRKPSGVPLPFLRERLAVRAVRAARWGLHQV